MFFVGCGESTSTTSTPSITAKVNIKNISATNIADLFIKESTSSQWGDDYLNGMYIAASSTVSFETIHCNTLIDIKGRKAFPNDSIFISEQKELPCGREFTLVIGN